MACSVESKVGVLTTADPVFRGPGLLKAQGLRPHCLSSVTHGKITVPEEQLRFPSLYQPVSPLVRELSQPLDRAATSLMPV